MRLIALLIAVLFTTPTLATDLVPREGWAVYPTSQSYAELVERMAPAIKAEGMGLVTQAGPTDAAKARGVIIPGSRVFGVFNNKIAVRTLALSVAAMIEAPIRMYVTENADGTATLSYKLPSHVFAPYADEGGAGLAEIGTELDGIFGRIAARAIAP